MQGSRRLQVPCSAALMLGLTLLTACPQPAAQTNLANSAARNDLTPTSKGERLTPTSKGERLTPTSKGERVWGGRLEGTVINASDGGRNAQKVADALIRIEGTELLTYSDAQGHFAFPEVPLDEAFVLSAEKADADGANFRGLKQVRIPAVQPVLRLDALALEATGVVLGQVKLADGADAAGIDLAVPGTSLATRTDRDGRFALADMPAGSYRLSLHKPGYADQLMDSVRLLAGSVVKLPPAVLARASENTQTARVRGRISSGGESLSGARVSLVGAELSQTRVVSVDDEGNYLLDRIEPGKRYDLLVTRPFHTSALLTVTPESDQVLEKNVELEAEGLSLGRLHVTVETCQHEAVASALIQLDPSPALGPVPFTDNRGQLTLGALLPGKYTVYAARGEKLDVRGVVIDNRQLGSDGKPGALAKVRLTLDEESCK